MAESSHDKLAEHTMRFVCKVFMESLEKKKVSAEDAKAIEEKLKKANVVVPPERVRYV